jgi:hypothetical protein
MNDLVPIDFHGDAIWTVPPTRRSGPPVSLRPIVERFGLSWSSQLKRVRRDDVLSPSVVIMTTETAAGPREAICLPLNLLPGFLFGISTGSIPDPEVRERVLTYKRECHDVLYQHFFGRVAERRSRAFRDELATKVKAVQVAMQLSSIAAARSVWNELGMPHLPDEDPAMRPARGSGNARRTVEPALDFDGSFGEDPRLVAVRQFLVELVEPHEGGEITSHVLSFDNVSRVDSALSDSLCRMSTGNGFLVRKLHSDGEPFHFYGVRPVILNGIPALTDRADLADRALTVQLQAIPESERRSELEWWADWDAASPRILGALLDAVSAAVRTIDQVKLARAPRLADFAVLMAAAEPGLGWDVGTFAAAYEENRTETAAAAFEADPVAMAVDALMKDRYGVWEGTASMLLGDLNVLVSEDMRRSKFWPTKANALGSALRRAAPLLRRKGIEISERHTGDQRYKTITKREG